MDKNIFESKVQKIDSGCWLWTRCVIGFGYGQLRLPVKDGGRRILAHRYAYELYISSIPNGLQVLHKCDVPRCVNPEHLFLGTTRDNMNDMITKNRTGKRGRPAGTGRFMPKKICQ